MSEREREMKKELQEVLLTFVKRIINKKTTSETEVRVLPEVASVLKDLLMP